MHDLDIRIVFRSAAEIPPPPPPAAPLGAVPFIFSLTPPPITSRFSNSATFFMTLLTASLPSCELPRFRIEALVIASLPP